MTRYNTKLRELTVEAVGDSWVVVGSGSQNLGKLVASLR